MYLIKQSVGLLFTPLMIALLFACAALALRQLRHPRISRAALGVALGVAYLGSTHTVGDVLLGPLERQYRPLSDTGAATDVRHIVVLGSAYLPADGLPVTAELDAEGLVRIVEGVRIARQFPAARLVVSGGAPGGRARSADGYAKLAHALGINDNSLVILGNSLDTDDEAREIHALVGNAPFFLVTSASHMPRAVRLMIRSGCNPIPAPTGNRVRTTQGFELWRWLPGAAGLRKSEQAMHEFVGIAAMGMGLT